MSNEYNTDQNTELPRTTREPSHGNVVLDVPPWTLFLTSLVIFRMGVKVGLYRGALIGLKAGAKACCSDCATPTE